jgi:hypothetical protein
MDMAKSMRSLRENVLRRAGLKSPPAQASKYIHHLDEYHKRHPDNGEQYNYVPFLCQNGKKIS